jgi:ubiquinone biosynthesis protein UbiJ
VGGVQLNGDLAIGQQFEEALSALEPDWRIPLERLLGRETADVLVRVLSGLGRAIHKRLLESAEAWKDHARHGARWSVSGTEWHAFVDEIQDAAGHLARLEARLKRLETKPTCNG